MHFQGPPPLCNLNVHMRHAMLPWPLRRLYSGLLCAVLGHAVRLLHSDTCTLSPSPTYATFATAGNLVAHRLLYGNR